MAPSPKKIEEYKVEKPIPPAKKSEVKKVPNCFVMNTPPKPGMVPVSTDQVKDGCFVMTWQTQQVTMLVSDAPQWYSFASKILKVDVASHFIFVGVLLLILVLIRERF